VDLHGKRDGMIVHGRSPLNAEPPRAALAEGPITAHDAFYVRNHGPVPETPAGARLIIGGLVGRPLILGLDDLRERAADHREVTATLQCAGNRRRGLIAVRDIPGEAPWGPGATGTARWTGVPLAALLAEAGPLPGARHVGFAGRDRAGGEDPEAFGGSIPLDKALSEEVIVAWAMNGRPLPPVHGAPLRMVVPGYIGARSVKWLHRIELRAEPWAGVHQQVSYRLLRPDEEPGPGRGVELGELALNAEVLVPDDGARVPAGRLEVRGYALAGGARSVARVDVSGDAGANWTRAELLDDLGRWAWRTWRAHLHLPPGRAEIVARAWDSDGDTHPEHAADLWNPKGYFNNSWARIALEVVG
jgi:sulfite oxidase